MKARKISFIRTLLVMALVCWGLGSYAQDTTTTVGSMQATQQNLENSHNELETLRSSYRALKEQSDKLLMANDSIRRMISSAQQESFNSQQQLYENNYSIIANALNDIENVRKQINAYGKLLDVAIAGSLITALNSPTNSELGTSFSNVVIQNSHSILAKDLSGKAKNKFTETITRVVSIPVVSTLAATNPVTSIVQNVFQQAVGYGDNAIKEQTIKDFMRSLEPYIEFYISIDQKTTSFRDDLLSYRRDLKKFENVFDRYSQSLYVSLGATETTAKQKMGELFKYSSKGSLSSTELRNINNAGAIQNSVAIVNKSPDLLVDQSPFDAVYNQYLDDIIRILEQAKSNSNLKFDANKLDHLIRELAKTKVK
ncbi:hypothetical protein FAZ15_15120 [Sphingobacterium olei]|uniref:Uncharacterized protein n=1 Tax=Sphingobacterium olei TaxID=2571155 RepID=A0A4U0NLV8_9SPHI|nr:hypothetical protein [Sphingobacterium olei]TJZ54802.1 hypothetical protein FAZ15_15120 [Sphingobacterium olei]